ncbi:MAG: FKBP-type peptidyl-prolyl cis-trans isomerase [Alistipes sp.]|nr:FKBP-type peptidyl-prolyl cis-trans isomerase [Alistipes sp.]
MKRLLCIAAVAIPVMLAGCKKDENKISNQQTSIVRYLESGHQPRLISEAAARESLDENPPYYTVYDNAAYRYVATIYDEGRDELAVIEPGDLVSIYFNAYVFAYSSLTNTMPYWSNRADVIAAMEQTGGGLDPEYWNTEPLVLRAGSDDVVRGVSRSLVGCCEGDEVEVYMTYEAAYGSRIVGLVPKESPVAWLFTIAGVEKR